jgi:hypothetical protein
MVTQVLCGTHAGCVHEVTRDGVLARVFMFWDEVND